MSQFDYNAYAATIRGLAEVPEQLMQAQEQCRADIRARTGRSEQELTRQLEELDRIGQDAFGQFNEVASTCQVLFGVAVSRPVPQPNPLTVRDALAAQNRCAAGMKTLFDEKKQEALEKKRQEIEAAQAEQRRLEEERRREEEEQRRREEEQRLQAEEAYRRELERANRSVFRRMMDFLAGN